MHERHPINVETQIIGALIGLVWAWLKYFLHRLMSAPKGPLLAQIYRASTYSIHILTSCM